MKITLQNRASRLQQRRSSMSGVALVIVLGMLTLIAILLIAFLNSASTELRSAKSYAVGLDSRSLNDSAVNIVISQIQDATATPTNAWASQPGMIRTYNPSGAMVMAYKLYSSNTLRTSSFNPVSSVATEVPPTWMNYPDQYVDLNKPVVSSGSITNYPIIDPAAVATSQSTGPLNTTPTAMDGSTAPIQGCYIDTTSVDGTNGTLTTSSSQSNPVPMPVQWLYVLQDGTFATISSTGTISNATTANPIVGRMAFWTDDESCKVNVNTAGEGTFWDRPSTESAGVWSGYERGFLSNIPEQNEFQRYPGHPAMTSLSVIFPPSGTSSTTPLGTQSLIPTYNEALYSIIPRLATGGTKSGTTLVGTLTAAMTPNSYRLYDTVDEFLFSATGTTPPRTANFDPAKTASSGTFTESQIEKTRFFLTANSRSPEVNLFNKPRICLWPIQYSTAARTVKDQLIAFCTTLGGTTPYYFQRYSTFDPTQAVTQGAPVPSSQSQTADWSNVSRNQTLYAYLQSLTSNPIPGLGGSLTTQSSGTVGKYRPSVCNQILTEMMDFIRSMVNSTSVGTTPSYFYAPGIASGSIITADHQVVPLAITPSGASYTTRGFGRFETIQQAALVFYRMDAPTINNAGTVSHSYSQYPPVGTISATTPAHVGVVLLLQPFCPSPGSRPWCENMRYVVTGLSGCLINGNPLTSPFPDPAVLLLNAQNDVVNASAEFGPEFFFKYYGSTNGGYKVLGDTTPYIGSTSGSITEAQLYPFTASETLTGALSQTGTSTPVNNGTFNFTPTGSITISVYPGYDPTLTGTGSAAAAANMTALLAETPLQTITMTFSPGGLVRLPIPTAIANLTLTGTTYLESETTQIFNNRIGNGTTNSLGIDQSGQHNPLPLIIGSNALTTTGTADGDVVRNIEARSNNTPSQSGTFCVAKGDLRIYSALANVPSDYFEAHGMMDYPADGFYYNAATTGTNLEDKIIHSLRTYSCPGTTMTSPNYGTYKAYGGPKGGLIWDSGSTTTWNYFEQSVGSDKQSLYPAVPRGLTPTQVQLTGLDNALHPGDWDTGPGDQPDGPYINKPEESNANDNALLFAAGKRDELYTYGSNQNGGNVELNETGSLTTYSPNRQISSAVAFGSLPSGIDPANPDAPGATINSGSQSGGGIRPWQTLLFCPNPAANATATITGTGSMNHPGLGTPVTVSGSYTAINAPQPPPYSIPPDWAFLDFFTMPIVEPYAISEPFSTAGKVNMNYQIVPFTYLVRDTAVRAVLKSDRIKAIPASDKGSGSSTTAVYKVFGPNANMPGTPDYRYTINPDESVGTLAGFQLRFGTGDIFRSASEICSLYLVPQYKVTATGTNTGESISGSALPTTGTTGANYNNMSVWWNSYTLTGDNLREAPYGFLYPRLTTKSNTFTVHVWTQTLKKVPGTSANQFVDNTDQITSEYRGSYIIQRYLDPNSDTLVTATGAAGTETDPNSMVGPYKFRVVATKRFAP